MEEVEINSIRHAEHFYQRGQMKQAQAALQYGLKLYPNNIVMQNLLQQYQDMKDLNIINHIPQENIVQETNVVKFDLDVNAIKQNKEHDNEKKQKINSISRNSFEMRLKVVIMELNVVETFSVKKLIENESDKIRNIKSYIGIVITALDQNYYEEDQLLIAESLSTELMRKIKILVKKKPVKSEAVVKPEDDIEVPDYRSIVTVRGDNEDVINCIIKAKKALDNCNYDSAERLLIKAERIRPTKNARRLLEQVRAAKEVKQNSDTIEIATEAKEHVESVNEQESKVEGYSVDAVKCLTAFETAFSTGKFEKAERMLNKAKRLDPSLDVEEKLSQVNAAKTSQMMEDIRKKEIEKGKRQCKSADECLYMAIKAYGAGDFHNAEHFFLRAKSFDPMLNLDSELSIIKSKTDSKISKENKDIDKNRLQETVINCEAAEYLYKAKKAYDAGNFRKAEQKFNITQMFDGSLDLELYLSKCKAETAIKAPQKPGRDDKNEKLNAKAVPKQEQVKQLLTMTENANHNKKIDDAMNFLTTAEELYPTEHAKILPKQIRENSILRKETCLHLNYYELPVEINDSNKEETLKCLNLAQAAIDGGRYDRAEHFLLKSQRICDSQQVNSLLETVHKAKAIEIKPNDNARKQLKHIKDVRKPQPSHDEASTSETAKSDVYLKRKSYSEMLANKAFNAMSRRMYDVARVYLKHAFEIHPNKQIRDMLRDVQEKINSRKGRHSLSKYDMKFEANNLLDKAEILILRHDLEQAELFLIVSWDMNKSDRTTIIHKKFLEARKAQFIDKGNQRDGRNDKYSENVFNSDKFVLVALREYENNKLEDAETSLTEAFKLCPSVRITKLLDEIRSKKGNSLKKFVQRCTKKLF